MKRLAKVTRFTVTLRLFYSLVLYIGLMQGSYAADPITFICDYPQEASPEGLQTAKHDFRLTFIVDEENDQAYFVGMLGTTKVQMLKSSEGSVTFIERIPTNTIQVTAIDSKNNSAHSRHTIIDGELVPSQWYGTCERK